MSRMLLSWFERRRKSKTLELAQNQIIKAIDTVNELYKAIAAFSEGIFNPPANFSTIDLGELRSGLELFFLIIQAVFLFLGFLRIKVIFHVCLPISSEFLPHWRWSPPVLSVFTDFLSWLSWLSKIYTKKAPSGV